MSEVKFFRVGGCVRDKLLGLPNSAIKDIDFTVVCESFDAMRQEILNRNGEIFLETPEFFTIRAKVPSLGCTDFVLARKDGAYSDGRHPDEVQMGTLEDDLARRDFTMNAIAEDEDGNLIDPFGGREDIKAGIIRCVGNAEDRFNEDSLRMLRALRFAITKNMLLQDDIVSLLGDINFTSKIESVSEERIREELHKMFKHDTPATLEWLHIFPHVARVVFDNNIWLMPTTKDK